MLSRSHRFLFVHIPKTAGNSIQNILRAYSDDEVVCHNKRQDGVERFNLQSKEYATDKHSTLATYRREYGPELYRRLYKFTCVRNPWHRAISFYFSPHRGKTAWDRAEFCRFVETMKPVAEFLSATPTEVQDLPTAAGNVDYIMRIETLADDFQAVCGKIGLPAQSLPVRNRSERDPHLSYYDKGTQDLVFQRFREEIEYFNYSFE